LDHFETAFLIGSGTLRSSGATIEKNPTAQVSMPKSLGSTGNMWPKNDSTRHIWTGQKWERTGNLDFSSVAAPFKKANTYVCTERSNSHADSTASSSLVSAKTFGEESASESLLTHGHHFEIRYPAVLQFQTTTASVISLNVR